MKQIPASRRIGIAHYQCTNPDTLCYVTWCHGGERMLTTWVLGSVRKTRTGDYPDYTGLGPPERPVPLSTIASVSRVRVCTDRINSYIITCVSGPVSYEPSVLVAGARTDNRNHGSISQFVSAIGKHSTLFVYTYLLLRRLLHECWLRTHTGALSAEIGKCNEIEKIVAVDFS